MAEMNIAGNNGTDRGVDSIAEEQHEAGKREVEMYIRTYQTLLRSSGEVGLKALVQAHYNIDSVLHPEARSSDPDMSAFIYTVLRLPTAILQLLTRAARPVGRGLRAARLPGGAVAGGHRLGAAAQVVLRRQEHAGRLHRQRQRHRRHRADAGRACRSSGTSFTGCSTPTPPPCNCWRAASIAPRRSTPRSARSCASDCTSASKTGGASKSSGATIVWANLLAIGRERKNFTLRMLGGSHVGFVRATRKWWAPVDQAAG